MRVRSILLLAALAVPATHLYTYAHTVDPAPVILPAPLDRPRVDIALLLDTSNSMDGLINQAKSQLWRIVQEFGDARLDGKAPILRVSLFEYGNSSLPATEGYIRQVVPLTDDLDQLSDALFGLRTNGGDEYCGQVINEAVKRLDWSSGRDSFKAIFIAGNEPFTQGGVDYKDAVMSARNRGIAINTIHCGSRDQGISGMWQDGSVIGRGEFFNINQDRNLPDIRTPYDETLGTLNRRLNSTYLWYGSSDDRDYLKSNQIRQDANAEQMAPASAAQRYESKASSAYSNRGRDLVDTIADDEAAVRQVKKDELPEEMRDLSEDERVAYVKEKQVERQAIQEEIRQVAAEREVYYQAELQKLQSGNAEQSLGDAMVQAVRSQLEEVGYDTRESPVTQPAQSAE